MFKMKYLYSIAAFLMLFVLSCNSQSPTSNSKVMSDSTHKSNPYYSRTDTAALHVSDEEWKKILPEDVYYVARTKGTERAYTGKYWDETGRGTYYCAACGNALFRSDAWFASHCGWPSFYESIRKNAVVYHPDNSYGMTRDRKSTR